ncbi:hypothetical protein E5Q_05701 [Mixia osmundae IAM 14324]|uniref:Uncharacterized protein n=1 Tax=Mixia osmundae (strain CBS 9802 / IAM 14324 / JCM 22182 / KY 12970) TaxID=764103 RepID=G7E852_MIXOS|nr:hypothetical protein E5Q_05701 [Mixia osmundae IAM 14324]
MASYAIVPGPSTSTNKKTPSTLNGYGLHDDLRFGQRSLAAQAESSHPLERHLDNYDDTQDALKMTLQRNLYGLHAPVRQMMERDLASQNPHFPGMGKSLSQLHLDVLRGMDELASMANVSQVASDSAAVVLDQHTAMERQRGL